MLKRLSNFLRKLPYNVNKCSMHSKISQIILLVSFAIIPILLFISLIIMYKYTFSNLIIVLQLIGLIITLLELPLFIKTVAYGSKKAWYLLPIISYISMIILGFNTGTSLFYSKVSWMNNVSKGDSLVVLLIYILFLFCHNDLCNDKMKKNINDPYICIRKSKLQYLKMNQLRGNISHKFFYYVMDEYGKYELRCSYNSKDK